MRLQLAAASIVVCFAWPVAAQPRDFGEGQVSSKLSVYSDDDATTVATSSVDGVVGIATGLEVGAHVLVDSVSSASVDVVSAATDRWTENRVETGARVRKLVRSLLDFGVSYVHSQENDWRSHSVQASAGKDLFAKNTRVDVGYAHTANQVGRANDPTFEDELRVHSVQVSGSQILDSKTLLTVAYTGQFSSGYHASPYRFVRIGMGGVGIPESHPGSRRRHALSLRALRSLHRRVAVDSSYRLYGDDWGVVSHTASVAVRLQPRDDVGVRLRARGYYQGAAVFYAEQYSEVMRYMTSDRELSDFWDASVGMKLRWSSRHFEVDAKLDAIRYSFANFARLRERLAVVADVGLVLKW